MGGVADRGVLEFGDIQVDVTSQGHIGEGQVEKSVSKRLI